MNWNATHKVLTVTLIFVFTALFGRGVEFESNGLCFRLTGEGEVALTERLTIDGVNDYSGEIIVPSTVYYDGENYAVTAVDEYAFSATSVTAVVLPNSVKRIGQSAFADAYDLSQLTLPLSIAEIPRYCLAGTAIEDLAIPEGVTRIGYGAMQECAKLHSVFLPSTLSRIEDHAFDWCINLYEIYCNAQVPPRVDQDTFASIARVDLVVTDDAVADNYSTAAGWNSDELFTIYSNEDLSLTPLAVEQQAFRQNWSQIKLGEHLAYKIYGEDGVLLAYTAARDFYLPVDRHDVVYMVEATTGIGDGAGWEVEVSSEMGIDRIIDEPFSPVPEPLITARDGQIHVWGDNYRRAIRVWDIYGMLYFERFTDGNEAIELPQNRIYIVAVDNYVKKVLL